MLAILYLQGALAPDCALVHFAAAGEMAQVGACQLGCLAGLPLGWAGPGPPRLAALARRQRGLSVHGRGGGGRWAWARGGESKGLQPASTIWSLILWVSTRDPRRSHLE